ncbi:Uncharacterised protein [Klebsiella pneumoniae]|nr:Uncharacterised protein [Klebsiella pneumoniae]
MFVAKSRFSILFVNNFGEFTDAVQHKEEFCEE